MLTSTLIKDLNKPNKNTKIGRCPYLSHPPRRPGDPGTSQLDEICTLPCCGERSDASRKQMLATNFSNMPYGSIWIFWGSHGANANLLLPQNSLAIESSFNGQGRSSTNPEKLPTNTVCPFEIYTGLFMFAFDVG